MNGCASGFRMSPVNTMQTTISQQFSTSFGDLAQQAIRAQSLIPSNIGQRIIVLDYIRDTYTCTSPRVVMWTRENYVKKSIKETENICWHRSFIQQSIFNPYNLFLHLLEYRKSNELHMEKCPSKGIDNCLRLYIRVYSHITSIKMNGFLTI